MRILAFSAPEKTLLRIRPLLVTVEMTLKFWRLTLARTTGVFPLGSVAATTHSIRTQAGFVPPLNLGMRCFRVFGDLWIALVEPLMDRHGRLLVSFLKWLLRREAPTLHILVCVPHGQADTEMRFDQFADRLAGLQRKAHLQLVGRVVLDQALDLSFLLGTKLSTAALGPAGTLYLHGCPAPRRNALCASTTVCVDNSHCPAVSRTEVPASRNFTDRRRRSFNAATGNLRESTFSISL